MYHVQKFWSHQPLEQISNEGENDPNSDMMAEIMKNIDFSKLMQPQNEPAKIEEIPDDEDALEHEHRIAERLAVVPRVGVSPDRERKTLY